MTESVSQARSGGIAFLVGAGPGDPGLLTVRGAQLLESADVVIYDALANPRLLSYCPRAELIYVGKRAAAHSMTQAQINAVLVQKTAEGHRVVRLKGGDPFVFGRGGEECEALAAAGLRFEVVPGITAAIAAPAYAGIPVTHRDFNSSFTLITGHEKEEEYRDDAARERGAAEGSSDIDWALMAKLPCVAFYMGVKSLTRICAKLIEHGMDAGTPAATIQWGTRPNQRTVVGTLADLPQRVAEAKITAPAISIVGRVVSMRSTIGWFETRPLFGKTIVVTRTRQQASELTRQLELLGANVIEAPTIELASPADWSEVDAALRSLTPSSGAPGEDQGEGALALRAPFDVRNHPHLSPLPEYPSTGSGQAREREKSAFDWVIFTSVNGVAYTKQRLLEIGLDARAFASCRIAAIGDATAEAVKKELCLKVDLSPRRFVAEALADALAEGNHVKGNRFLLLRAEIARPILRERLKQDGAAEVRDVSVYETRAANALPLELTEAMAAGLVDWVTFSSSSTATNFTKLLGTEYREKMKGVNVASIGPITTATLTELGLTPTVEAKQFDLNGLVKAIASACARTDANQSK